MFYSEKVFQDLPLSDVSLAWVCFKYRRVCVNIRFIIATDYACQKAQNMQIRKMEFGVVLLR